MRHAQDHWLKLQAAEAVKIARDLKHPINLVETIEATKPALEFARNHYLRLAADNLVKAELLHRRVVESGDVDEVTTVSVDEYTPIEQVIPELSKTVVSLTPETARRFNAAFGHDPEPTEAEELIQASARLQKVLKRFPSSSHAIKAASDWVAMKRCYTIDFAATGLEIAVERHRNAPPIEVLIEAFENDWIADGIFNEED